ncbi:MAG: lycopene beta-cyclase CrtY [Polyangiaceae bacterium]
MAEQFDICLVGGGLQNSLISLALGKRQPDLRVALIERGGSVGGNHLWCFHAGDLSPAMQQVVGPVVQRRWDGYEVRFPGWRRRLEEPYAAVPSDRVHQEVQRLFARREWSLRLGTSASAVHANLVQLDDGSELTAKLVIDARGPSQLAAANYTGFQKFVGLELELERDYAPEVPIVMDACVPQQDGYRFMYVLPLSSRLVLVEDTYFSTSSALNVSEVRTATLEYALANGMAVKGIRREEQGVLPLPWRTPAPRSSASPLRAGFQGGWFHPTTGYSFPLAARLADHVSNRDPASIEDAQFARLVQEQARQLRFSTWLNRLLFTGFSREERWQVLARFYRLPPETIRRFYAHDTTALDRARIVCGRPPRGLSLSSLISGGPHP